MADTKKEAELELEIAVAKQKIQEKDDLLLKAQIAQRQDLVDKAQQEINLLNQKLKSIENSLALERAVTQQRMLSKDVLDQEVDALQQKADSIDDELEKKQALLDLDKTILKQLEMELEIAKNQETIDEAEISSIVSAMEQRKRFIKEKENELQTAKKITDEEEKQKKLLQDKIDKTKQYLSSLTGGLLDSTAGMLKMENVAAAFGERLREVVTANEQFAATTGQLATDFGSMFSGTTGLEQFGIRSVEFQKNFGELYTSMAGFNKLSEVNQKILTENASKMQNLGFSVKESGEMYNILQNSLRMSATEIVNTQNKLAGVALAAGIAPSKMLKDFATAMPQLAAYGKQAVNVFADLEKQSKALGVEIGSLMSIVGESFDTFEGAADKAGKLNAILGGDYLNSVEMLNATESERIEMLKMAIEASGRNFDSMDKFQKKAIAASLGIKDVNEAQKLFGTSSAEMRAQMALEAAEQKRLEEVQKKAADSVKQLKGAFDELLIIARPLADGLKKVIEILAENKTVANIIMIIAALRMFGGVASFLASPFTAIIGMFRGAGGAANRSGSMMAGVIGRIGAAARQNAAGLITLGQVFLMVATGVAIAAAGIGFLVSAFNGLNTEQLQAVKEVLFGLAMGFAVIGITLLGIALAAPLLTPGVAILEAFGLAVLLIGAGIGIAAAGLSLLVSSIGKVSESAAGIDKLVIAMGEIAALGTIGSLGIIAGTTALVGAITAISKAVNEIPEEKTVKFTNILNSLNTNLSTAKSFKETDIKATTDFIQASKSYYEAQSKSKAADQDALYNSLKMIFEVKNKSAEESKKSNEEKNITVVLNIDGEKVAEKVLAIKPNFR
jgi:hypothetical protein